ncbi:MAG: MarR family winged helix-turn-helix transcriptional regulator [Nocardioides sp.]
MEPVPDSPSDPLSDALQLLLASHTQAQGRLARRLGASGTDVDALEHLIVRPLGPVALAERLGVTPAAASLAVSRLEGRGHARRLPDPDDGRRTQVVLTDVGRDTVLDHARPMLNALDEMAGRFTASETAAVLRYLQGAERALRLLG